MRPFQNRIKSKIHGCRRRRRRRGIQKTTKIPPAKRFVFGVVVEKQQRDTNQVVSILILNSLIINVFFIFILVDRAFGY